MYSERIEIVKRILNMNPASKCGAAFFSHGIFIFVDNETIVCYKLVAIAL